MVLPEQQSSGNLTITSRQRSSCVMWASLFIRLFWCRDVWRKKIATYSFNSENQWKKTSCFVRNKFSVAVVKSFSSTDLFLPNCRTINSVRSAFRLRRTAFFFPSVYQMNPVHGERAVKRSKKKRSRLRGFFWSSDLPPLTPVWLIVPASAEFRSGFS